MWSAGLNPDKTSIASSTDKCCPAICSDNVSTLFAYPYKAVLVITCGHDRNIFFLACPQTLFLSALEIETSNSLE